MSSGLWSRLATPVPDLVFKMDALAKAAQEPKINLVIGAYRDDNGKPLVLNAIRKAEIDVVEKMNYNKEYLPIDGFRAFCDASVELVFGKEQFEALKPRIASAQSLSGTGACRMLADFLVRTSAAKDETPVYLSNPTWANHAPIFQTAGFKHIRHYEYFDKKTNGVAIEAMLRDLSNAPEGSIIVLHMCAHNPTGADPSHEEWARIADVVAERKLVAFFDSAYQGYASGDLARDAYAARLFASKGLEFCIAQSYAKNMGLYAERVGCASVITSDPDSAVLVQGVLKNVIRPNYSNPPAHGARVAHHVMTDAALRAEWEEEMRGMSGRIVRMRTILRDELVRLGTPGTWDHITKQIGMFSYLGLNEDQCKQLVDRRVFLLPSSRISVAGLTADTAKDLAKHIDEIIRGEK